MKKNTGLLAFKNLFVRTKRNSASVLMAIAMTSPLSAQTVEERLARLEEEVRALRQENEELRRKVAAPTAAPEPAAERPPVKPGGAEEQLQLGGFIQAQLEGGGRLDSRFSDENDRAFLRRTRLYTQGLFAEAFDFRVELDLSGGLSNASGLRAQLTDGYITWKRHPYANVRVGQFKTPFGHEQLVADTRLLTPERSLATDRLSPGRQIGLQIGGELARNRVAYALGAFNGTGTNVNFNDDEEALLAGRLTARFLDRPKVVAGINALRSVDRNVALPADFGFDSTPSSPNRDNIFAGRRHGVSVDAQLTAGLVEVWVESLRMRFEPDNAIPQRRFDSAGWYGHAGYFVIADRVQAVLHYEAFDPNDEASGDDTRTWGIGGNYFIKGHDLKVQLQYMRNQDGDDRLITRLQVIF